MMDTGTSNDRYWQNWDNGEAAKKINDYWEANEAGWREALVGDIRKVWGVPSSVFEMGCGSGLIFEKMRERGLVTPSTYSGGDVSLRMLEIAQTRAPNLNLRQLDIFDIDLPDQSQENVINIHVIQHLPYYEEPIRELVRITKKRLYLCSWFKSGTDEIQFSPTSDWDNQGFQNNYYSLDKVLTFIRDNWSDCIETLEVRTFDELNRAIVISFKDGVPRRNLKQRSTKATTASLPTQGSRGLLQGVNVSLRLIERSDLGSLVQWRNDPKNWEQFCNKFPLSDGQQSAWFEKLQGDSNRKLFAVLIPSGEAIGTVGFDSIDFSNQKAEIGNILIGNTENRGKGYAKEAVCLLADYAFLQLNLNRLFLHVFEDNADAVTLYQKVGFQIEGILREAHFSQGHFRNVLVMGLLREEYLKG